jgi:hypothetical protein
VRNVTEDKVKGRERYMAMLVSPGQSLGRAHPDGSMVRSGKRRDRMADKGIVFPVFIPLLCNGSSGSSSGAVRGEGLGLEREDRLPPTVSRLTIEA